MRCPAGVGDADMAAQGRGIQRLLQRPDLAHGTLPLDPPVSADDREASRVIAAIFQAPQAFEQDRHRIALRDDSDDSAHGCCNAPRLGR